MSFSLPENTDILEVAAEVPQHPKCLTGYDKPLGRIGDLVNFALMGLLDDLFEVLNLNGHNTMQDGGDAFQSWGFNLHICGHWDSFLKTGYRYRQSNHVLADRLHLAHRCRLREVVPGQVRKQ